MGFRARARVGQITLPWEDEAMWRPWKERVSWERGAMGLEHFIRVGLFIPVRRILEPLEGLGTCRGRGKPDWRKLGSRWWGHDEDMVGINGGVSRGC